MIDTHPNPTEIVRAEGYIYMDPDESIDINDQLTWGTKLGFSKEASIFISNFGVVQIFKEETGNEVRDILTTGSSPVFNCFLRNYNENVLQCLFPNMVSNGVVNFPYYLAAGTSLLSVARRFIYIPNDYEENFSILIKSGVPRHQTNGFLTLSHSKEVIFAIYIDCLRKSDLVSDSAVKIGLLEDII